MSRRLLEDDRAPWSFFVPMMLAVAFGVLIADGVRSAIVEVFADRIPGGETRAPTPAARVADAPPSMPAPQPAPIPSNDASPASTSASAPPAQPAGKSPIADAPPTPDSADAAAADTPSSASPSTPSAALSLPSTDAVQRLPGSTTARRDALPRACINGTVAVRDRNGWQQELSSERPVRCEQTSP